MVQGSHSPIGEPLSDLPLAGRAALVTGGSSGIGRGIALALAQAGARVVIVARGEDRLREVAERDGRISWLATSVESPKDRRNLVSKTRETVGPITVFVHAAARGGYHDRPIHEMSLASWRSTMNVNLDAAFDLTRLLAPEMIASRSGSNAVCPGWVRETGLATEGTRFFARQTGRSDDEIWSERASHYPDGRLVTIDEVARTTTFLASQRSPGVNGEAVTVAHGGTW